MNLGAADASELATIVLHEVGHAFGMDHEWDARTPLVHDGKNPALSQHAQRCVDNNKKSFSNFPGIDKKSVMSYFLPAAMTQGGRGIKANLELSDADKAWLVVNYPGRHVFVDGIKWDLLRALDLLDVSLGDASLILGTTDVADQRAHYAEVLNRTWGTQAALGSDVHQKILGALGKFDKRSPGTKSNLAVVSKAAATNTPSATDDTPSIFAALVLHPEFRSAITNLVESELDQRPDTKLKDYPIQYPPTAAVSDDPQQFLGALLPIAIPLLAKLAGSVISGLAQSGIAGNAGGTYYPGTPLPVEAQQGIFDVVSKIVKNPAFTKIISTIATTVATEVFAAEKAKDAKANAAAGK
ncbi:hypothetical protein B0H14DRAFT_2946590 [Mycena olivaceomarginata]|nr:hypothetical protein B0H14DRAFT_2946590 [Mycena olivaceomarginata]